MKSLFQESWNFSALTLVSHRNVDNEVERLATKWPHHRATQPQVSHGNHSGNQVRQPQQFPHARAHGTSTKNKEQKKQKDKEQRQTFGML